MELEFEKLNGLGNDFVFIDDMSAEINLTTEDIVRICDRHFGVGADGVILVRPSANEECDAYMHYINSDGSLAQMCGNGVRCFAKYLVEHEYVDAEKGFLVADTLSGPKMIRFVIDERGEVTSAAVDMGEPLFAASYVPVNPSGFACDIGESETVVEMPINSPWGIFKFTCLSIGNPHAVCIVDDWSALPDELFIGSKKSLSSLEISKIGAYFESCDAFPEKANIEFAEIVDDGINMRVFERGCGETLACGTGACATSLAASIAKGAPKENDIHLLGGTLHILWDDDDHVIMTGPAKKSFSGRLDTKRLS